MSVLAAYGCAFAVLLSAAAIGQAVLTVSGRPGWSPLAPAVGLAALVALAWGLVRLPGEGTIAVAGLTVASAAALLMLWRQLGAVLAQARADVPLALAACALGSLPFLVEGRVGILGTGLNPDMSQHLFAAERLASGETDRLISEGYPLGPHSLVVALGELGAGPVQAFDGLMLAVLAATALAAAAAFEGAGRWSRYGGALTVAVAYLLASTYAQGAFKELMQALFLLAFAVGLGRLAWKDEGGASAALRAVPLAVLAVGSVYTYSFPGLIWLGGAAAAWLAAELVLNRGARRRPARAELMAGAVAAGVLVVALLPELGRLVSFASFETFDPDGAGLGNLFNRLSPLEALGIWPSGDFRVEPGDGAVPAAAFYAGAAIGLAALAFGLRWSLARRELAVPAALAAATALWVYSLVAGTPYQEAKALVLAAPLVALLATRALLASAPAAATGTFMLAAGGSGLLALANAPVGPAGYSTELAELRTGLGPGSTVVFAPPELLAEQHGRDYLVWELRGNRICVSGGAPVRTPPGASALSVRLDEDGAVVPAGLERARSRPGGREPCPFIPDGARADPAADG